MPKVSKETMIKVAMIAAIAAAVVYASNNDLPLVGSVVKKAIG